MNKINTKILEFYYFWAGGEQQFSSLPQAQKTLVTALDYTRTTQYRHQSTVT
jgi:hypothetical protein